MEIKPNINPLLESIVEDNFSFEFPIETIRTELLQMLLNQNEFDYFVSQCHRKLKMSFPMIFSTVFFNTMMIVFDTDDDIYKMPSEIYTNYVLEFIDVLENLQVTRIEKDSPDGEIMSSIK